MVIYIIIKCVDNYMSLYTCYHKLVYIYQVLLVLQLAAI